MPLIIFRQNFDNDKWFLIYQLPFCEYQQQKEDQMLDINTIEDELDTISKTPTFFEKPTVKLLWGTTGTYLCLFIVSLLDEKIFKTPYQSFTNPGQTSLFKYPLFLIIMQNLMCYSIAKLINTFAGSKSHIPWYLSLKTALLSVASNTAFHQGVIYTSLPLALLFRSCNILSTIIVGVFCSKVKSQGKESQKLGSEKLPIGIIISIGILIFYYGNTAGSLALNNSAAVGVGLLLICITCDAFETDFKAEIKQQCKPSSLEMLQHISKYGFILSLITLFVTKQYIPILDFLYQYPSILLDAISQSLMLSIGLMFLYYIITNFQQHIAPLILTTRKVISAVISIMVFNHQINLIQWTGLSLVLVGTLAEFVFPSIISKLKEWKKYKNYTMI